MPDPDVLRCPGCGNEPSPTLDALTGALRCERCGAEVPIPGPATPGLHFDEPPPLPVEPPPLPPTTLDIEYWFQDAPKPSEEPKPPVLDDIASEPPPLEMEVAEVPDESEPKQKHEPQEPMPELAAEEPPPTSVPPSTPEPSELTIVDAPLPGVPLLPTPTVLKPAEDAAPADDIPVVQPRSAPVVPKAKAVAANRPKPAPMTVTRPRDDGDPPQPKPQLGLALFVMAVLFLVVVIGMSVIGYAIWTGLRSASKPRTETDAVPTLAHPFACTNCRAHAAAPMNPASDPSVA